VLLASWTDAEQEAAVEHRRAEALLASLAATVQEPRPPPVPPPKPAFEVVAAEPAPDAAPPALPDTVVPAPGDKGSRTAGPEGVQLAYAVAGDDAVEALPSAPAAANSGSWDGTWIADSGTWRAEWQIEDGSYRLSLDCARFHETASGLIDASGRIYAVLSFNRTTVSGTPERLDVIFLHDAEGCPSGTLQFDRLGDAEPQLAAIDPEREVTALSPPGDVTRTQIGPFDGRWAGKGIIVMAAGSGCPGTIVIEMQVLDGKITGFKKSGTGTTDGAGYLAGAIDASGRLETYGPLLRLRGVLSPDTGRGSGEWTKSNHCQGVFEIARVE
jgi:hypothetical protein